MRFRFRADLLSGYRRIEDFLELFPTGLRTLERTDTQMRRWAARRRMATGTLYRHAGFLETLGFVRILKKDVRGRSGTVRRRKVWRFYPLDPWRGRESRIYRALQDRIRGEEPLEADDARKIVAEIAAYLWGFVRDLSNPSVTDREVADLLEGEILRLNYLLGTIAWARRRKPSPGESTSAARPTPPRSA